MVENNLLLALHKWASRQDENFLTEAFVHLVRHLLQYEPGSAVNILKELTNGRLDLKPQDAARVSITTQVTILEGRPDIVIMVPNHHLVVVEVKAGLKPYSSQLRHYRSWLSGQSGFEQTSLILLTQYPLDRSENEELLDFEVCWWYRVAERLGREFKTIQRAESIYVVNQFLEFMKGMNMTMEKRDIGQASTTHNRGS